MSMLNFGGIRLNLIIYQYTWKLFYYSSFLYMFDI
jgi:hypothetical protein